MPVILGQFRGKHADNPATLRIHSSGHATDLSLLLIMTSAIVSARIPVKDFDAVNLRAKEEKVSRTAVVMKALEAYLKTPVAS